jgi:uncharacterized protein (TIGR03437 family)
MKRVLGLMVFSVAAFAQTPAVTQILNNYSLINAGSVAQGAIFIVKGSSLSDQSTGLQSVPLTTTLVGVRMEITVGGTTTFAPMYYALPTQLAGILPSSTPTGTGTLTVRNNGRSSAPAAITVVRSAFGMLTVSGDGTGAARLQDASQGSQELSPTRATNPGNFLVFYGSGVGATTGDETVAQLGANASGDLTGISISVSIGGQNAPVLYRGRTAFPGLDQINVQMPTLAAGAYGCNVAVVITTNGVAANATTIPVAASGTTCPPPPSTGGGGATPTPTEITEWINRGNYTFGTVNIGRNTHYGTTTTRSSSITAIFGRVSGLSADLQSFLTPSIGGCTILRVAGVIFPGINFTYFDAGPSVTASGPNGAQVATRQTVEGTIQYNAENLPITFITSGRYTLTGTGGAQVGAFSGALDVGDEIVWTNYQEARTVTRSNPLTVRWTGASLSQYVSISGSSITLEGGFTSFTCLANRSAGQFTVPASVLSQLPASPDFGGFAFPGSMSISGTTSNSTSTTFR